MIITPPSSIHEIFIFIVENAPGLLMYFLIGGAFFSVIAYFVQIFYKALNFR